MVAAGMCLVVEMEITGTTGITETTAEMAAMGGENLPDGRE